MGTSNKRLVDSFCMELNGGPASSTPIKSTSIALRQNCIPSPNAKNNANTPAVVQESQKLSQPNEENNKIINETSEDNMLNTSMSKIANKRKISPLHQKVQKKKMKTLLSNISLEKSIFENQIQTLLNNSSSFSDKIVTRKLYKQKSMTNCRKLYSIQSDFTDNDSIKTQDSSFLEKKDVVNIYIPTKSSETKSSVIQKNTSNFQKNTSNEQRKSTTYSLRTSNKDAANKQDTNKEIMDLLKDIQVTRDVSKNSLMNSKNDTKDCENFDESDCMFNNTDGNNHSLISNTIITKSVGKINKNNRTPSRKGKNVTNKSDKQLKSNENDIERQKSKGVTSKSKRIKEIGIKKKINVSRSKTLNRKKNVSVLNDKKKKNEKLVKNRSVSSGSRGKNSSIDTHRRKNQKTSGKTKSVSSELNKKGNGNRKTKKSNKNNSISSKSDEEEMRKRKTQKHHNTDNIYKKLYAKSVCKKSSKKRSYNKKNDESEDDIKDLARKYSSKYNHMAVQRIHTLDDSSNSDSSSDSGHNDRPFFEYNTNNDRRLIPCMKQKIPRFSQNIPCDPYQFIARSDDFEDFYQRYFPQMENRVVKKEPSFFFRGAPNSSSNHLSRPQMNFREMTMSFTNDLCRNEVEKPISVQDYDVRLYSKTKITIDDNCEDVFKLPIALPKKQRIIHDKKHNEPNHYTSMRDDISMGNQFMSESQHTFSSKPQPLQQAPHTNSTNYNKSVCIFTKKSNMNNSVSTIAPQDNVMASHGYSRNNVRNSYQADRYNTLQSGERDLHMYRNDCTSLKPTHSMTSCENNDNRILNSQKRQHFNYENMSSYKTRDQNEPSSSKPTFSISSRENYMNHNQYDEVSSIRSDERNHHVFPNNRTSAKPLFNNCENYENHSRIFQSNIQHKYREPLSSKISTVGEDFMKSPILVKHKNFHERLRLHPDQDESVSFKSKSVFSKDVDQLENMLEINRITALSKNDDSILSMDNDDDSWITVKRPAMVPCSPWRYSNSYK